MKYIDKATGCRFETEEIEDLVHRRFCQYPCDKCPMNGMKCVGLVHNEPDKAAIMIGLVPDIKLCYLLGVKVGEPFWIHGFNQSVVFEVQPNGQYKTTPEHVAMSSYAIIDAINNPDLVEKKPVLTAKEIELCRSLGVKYLYRGTEGIEASCVSMWKSKPDPPCVFPIGEWQTSFIGCLRGVDFKSIGCGMLFEVEG